jgi:hypothetical protein
VLGVRERVLILLISYAAQNRDDVSVDLSGVKRVYSLLMISHVSDTFQVDMVKRIPYQSVRFLNAGTISY